MEKIHYGLTLFLYLELVRQTVTSHQGGISGSVVHVLYVLGQTSYYMPLPLLLNQMRCPSGVCLGTV